MKDETPDDLVSFWRDIHRPERARYAGTTNADGTRKVTVRKEGRTRALPLCLNVFNHSPSGFNWGYSGSGPAQLSLAILMDHFDGDRTKALAIYQKLKARVIAKLDSDKDWILTSTQIQKAVDEILRESKD